MYDNQFNTFVYGPMAYNHAETYNVKLESTESLEISFFYIYLYWSYYKTILLESLNIPLKHSWAESDE